MPKKEAILIVLLVILSLLVITSIYFGFGTEKFTNLFEKKQQEQKEQQEVQEIKNATEEPEQMVEEMNETAEEEETSVDASLWCNAGDTVEVTSDLFVEGSATKTFVGVEGITLGVNITSTLIICEACHTTLTYSITGRKVDEWTNTDKLLLLGLEVDKEGCSKYVSSKTFLGTNESLESNDTAYLIFSNKTLVKEKWRDEEGRTCLVTNNILKPLRGAQCS